MNNIKQMACFQIPDTIIKGPINLMNELWKYTTVLCWIWLAKAWEIHRAIFYFKQHFMNRSGRAYQSYWKYLLSQVSVNTANRALFPS